MSPRPRLRALSAFLPLGGAILVAACSTNPTSGLPEVIDRTQAAQSVVPLRGMMRPPPKDRSKAALPKVPNGSYAPTNGCGSPLEYFGGRIISSPIVVQVSWNDPGSAVASSVETYLQSWWPAVLSSEAGYLSWLAEYDTAGKNGKDGQAGSNQTFSGFGTYAGVYHITPSVANQGATIGDAAIAQELIAQIQAGNLPQPTFDANGNCNTIYMIDFPPSVTDIQLVFAGSTSDSCSSFCGYHAGVAWGANQFIYYGVHPDFTAACTSCAPDGLDQDLAMVHSHELGEAMTDAEIFREALTASSTDFLRPGGWDQIASGCSEIGDSCAWPTTGIPTVTYQGQPYYVQGLFDNSRMDCEWSGANTSCSTSASCIDPLHPVCKASVCSGCTVDGDCTGNSAGSVCQPTGACGQCSATNTTACVSPTPVCNAATGVCVQCQSSAQCSGSTPICDIGSNACRACTPTDCTGPTSICQTTGPNAGKCVACNSDAQCASPTPFCDTTTDTCVACLTDASCPAAKPFCDSTSHTCRGCASNSDCASGTNHACDTQSGQCVACVLNSDCSSKACDTATHTCVQCVDDSECMNPTPVCNVTSHTCGTCTSNAQCAGNSQGPTCVGGSCTVSSSGSGSDGGGSSGSGGSSGGSSSGADADGGSSSGGGNGGSGNGGGCAVSPSPQGGSLAGLGVLMFGLASLLVRRRRAA